MTGILTGTVQAGGQALSHARMDLYASDGSDEGTALIGSTLSNSAGRFGFSDFVPAPIAGQVVFLVASGGSPIGASNDASRLMAMVGRVCDGCALPEDVTVNAFTTVAAVYRFGALVSLDSDTPSFHGVTGLDHAARALSHLVDSVDGTASADLAPESCTAAGSDPSCLALKKLNTLANGVDACAAASGASAPACSNLLSATGAADTLGALYEIAVNPVHRAQGSNVFAALGTLGSFTPALSAAPNDWTLALNHTGGGLNRPSGIAVASDGSVWAANNVKVGSVSKFAFDGAALSPAAGYTAGGLAGPLGIAIDASDNVWVANWNQGSGKTVTKLDASGAPLSGSTGYTATGMVGPIDIAVTGTGEVWVANYSNASLTHLSSTGSLLGSITGGGLNFPSGIALDAGGRVWVADQGNDRVSEFSSAGVPLSASGYGGMAQPYGIATDAEGFVWAVNFSSNSVARLVGGSTPPATCPTTPSASDTGCRDPAAGISGGGLSGPTGLAVDGAGHVWVSNFHGNNITELDADSSVLTPAMGYVDGDLLQPYGIAVDAAGSVWVTNLGGNSLTEFIGIATPIITPRVGPPTAAP